MSDPATVWADRTLAAVAALAAQRPVAVEITELDVISRSRSGSPTGSSPPTARTRRRTARAGTVASARRWRSCGRAVWWTPAALRRRPAWPGRYPRRRPRPRAPDRHRRHLSPRGSRCSCRGVIAPPLRNPAGPAPDGLPRRRGPAGPGDGRAQPALRRRRRRRVRAAGRRCGAGSPADGRPDPDLRAVRDRRAVDAGDEAAGRRRRRAGGWPRPQRCTGSGPTSRCDRTSTRPASRSRRTRPAARSTPSATGSCGRSWTPGSRRTTRTSPRTTRWTTGRPRPAPRLHRRRRARPPDGALDDEIGHGTHVAGIIAGAIAAVAGGRSRDGQRTVRATENRLQRREPAASRCACPARVERRPELLAGMAPRAQLVSLKVRSGGRHPRRPGRPGDPRRWPTSARSTARARTGCASTASTSASATSSTPSGSPAGRARCAWRSTSWSARAWSSWWRPATPATARSRCAAWARPPSSASA